MLEGHNDEQAFDASLMSEIQTFTNWYDMEKTTIQSLTVSVRCAQTVWQVVKLFNDKNMVSLLPIRIPAMILNLNNTVWKKNSLHIYAILGNAK